MSQPALKLCDCGCGEPAPIATSSHAKRGYVKGQPTRFRVGHGGGGGSVAIPLAERFWDRVAIAGPDDCWLWTGPRVGPMGYGRAAERKNTRGAHCVAFELSNGPAPKGAFICHTCDNPPCVNPAHLYAGTPADNMRDRDERGRAPMGSQCPIARLTEADIPLIFQLREKGLSLRAIGREFGVAGGTISAVLMGKTWKHAGVAA